MRKSSEVNSHWQVTKQSQNVMLSSKNLLKTNPTKDNWLHRRFRKQYLKGHTYVSNQIVYQNALWLLSELLT